MLSNRIDPDETAHFDLQATRAELARVTAAATAREAELAEQMAILIEAQALAHLGHWTMSSAGEDVTWSDELYRIFGLPVGRPMTRADFRDRVWPEDREVQAAAIATTLREGTPFAFTIRAYRADGRTCVLRNTGGLHVDLRGGPPRLMGVCLDVTAETEAEQILNERSEQLAMQTEELYGQTEELTSQTEELVELNAQLVRQRQLLDVTLNNVPGAVGYCGLDYFLRVANERYAAQLGLTVSEVIGKHAKELFPASYDAIIALTEHVVATDRPWEGRSLPSVVDGRQRFHDALLVPVHNEWGAVDGLLSLSIDVSDRVAAETLQASHIADLEALDRHKDEFLGVLSHELRTPLNFIMGFASLLDDEVQGTLNPEQHASLSKILDGTDRMLRLVEDLLDIAGIQAGRVRLSMQRADVAKLTRETIADLMPLATTAGLTLVLAPVRELPASCDPARVTQVLSNLLANAIKFTPAGGTITVDAHAVAGGVRVTVTDTGPGIEEADLTRVFGKFQQLDMSATRAAGGVGLGLAITKALVEAQGGTIGVESTVGVGSTFWFTLNAA